MNTEQIMQIALDMVGMTEIPPDSMIYVRGEGIKRALFGIDMGVAELLVAKNLGFDAVIAHHPQPAVLTFPAILDIHVEQMVSHGVPRAQAEKAISRMKLVNHVRHQTGNYDHAPSFARLLQMPYLNIHNPLDELGRRRMQQACDDLPETKTVGDVISALRSIPEIGGASTQVMVRVGEAGRPAGKTVVSHAAGTNGGYEVARAYFENGVDTLCYIHIDPAELARLATDFPQKNLVISGHIASDLAGIQPFAEELRNRGLGVVGVSGVR